MRRPRLGPVVVIKSKHSVPVQSASIAIILVICKLTVENTLQVKIELARHLLPRSRPLHQAVLNALDAEPLDTFVPSALLVEIMRPLLILLSGLDLLRQLPHIRRASTSCLRRFIQSPLFLDP